MPPTLRLVLVTDAWTPQVNGVVTTLVELVRGLERRGVVVTVIEPGAFRRVPCPGYREVEIAWRPGAEMARRLDALDFDALHLATEGPLGWAARRHARRRGWRFTTAFHTRVPEILAAAVHLPVSWGYALLRRFHARSAGVMVPSEGMLQILRERGFGRLRAWSHGVDLSLFRPVPGADFGLPRPVFLYLGRVSYEKNLEAFLDADLPGSKVVYGVGPLRDALQARHPQVHWRGVVPRDELAVVYAAADVFVFPGRHETFGLVMLEAMACGTPVAAFPVDGPLEVVADSRAGVMHTDLREAVLKALEIPRHDARSRALQFSWSEATRLFMTHLVFANRQGNVTPMSLIAGKLSQ